MINGHMLNKSEKTLENSKKTVESIKLSLCGLLTQNASVKSSKVKTIHGKT